MAPPVIGAMRRSAVIAAVLSFFWPGLGQGWAGAPRRALLFALPMMLLAVGGLLVIVVQGKARTFGLVLQPGVLLGLLALNLAVLGYRLLAIIDAYRVAHRRWPPVPERGQAALAAVLLGAVLGGTLLMHGYLGLVAFKTYDLVATVFHTQSTPTPGPSVSLAPGVTPGPTPVPTPVPTPQPVWSDNGRLDLLLIGGDAGPGRWSLRTDTMIILSVDVATGRAALFGVPRNLVNVPLPDGPAQSFACGCYPDLLNSLYVYAQAHPKIFPGADADRGFMAVQNAIATLTGLQIDGEVMVTLQGFVHLVDALGGLDMTTSVSVSDSRYPDPFSTRDVKIFIPAGHQHFDGWHALAYARSRHQDSDYNRMNRQQEVLRAFRAELDPCTLIPRAPQLLDIAKDSLWTNIPVDRLPDLFALAARVRPGTIAGYQFWPPTINEYLGATSVNRIRQMVSTVFTAPTPTPSAAPSTLSTPAPSSASFC